VLIGAKKYIRQTIVVYITEGNTATIKKITKSVWIKFFGINNIIGKVDTCFFCRKKSEKMFGLLILFSIAGGNN
jgi:hypothetical protein